MRWIEEFYPDGTVKFPARMSARNPSGRVASKRVLLRVMLGFSRQLSHRGQKAGSGYGITKRIECHCGRELRRVRPKLHLQNILLSRCHQSVQLWRGIMLPV